MYLGILAAFAEANDAGGVQGCVLFLKVIYDGCEPGRAFSVPRALVEHTKVFRLIGAVVSHTSLAVLPLADAGDISSISVILCHIVCVMLTYLLHSRHMRWR